jgi:mono/diheme cytochrome c family protein
MKTNLKNVAPFVLLVVGIFLFSFFSHPTQTVEKWVVPTAAKKMKNPTTPNSGDLAVGKMLYNKHCKSCHGSKGKGDGSKAGELDTDCGDFTKEEFTSQTDGEIFYKTKEGRDEMPTFKKKIPVDEDVWFVVNYVRTL